MHKQSNVPLYVVGGCVLAIAVIVAVVRSNADPEEKKPGSSLSDFSLTGLTESASPSASPAPAGSDGVGRVQMLPITVQGRQGLLVRYESEVLLEPVQQRMAQRILEKVKGQAENVGVEVIVVMAVAAGGGDGTSPLAAQTHTVAFERVVGGTWVQMEDPALSPAGSASGAASVPLPAGSASAPRPPGSEVPLFIPH